MTVRRGKSPLNLLWKKARSRHLSVSNYRRDEERSGPRQCGRKKRRLSASGRKNWSRPDKASLKYRGRGKRSIISKLLDPSELIAPGARKGEKIDATGRVIRECYREIESIKILQGLQSRRGRKKRNFEIRRGQRHSKKRGQHGGGKKRERWECRR